jgi:predicted dehydrogenase
LIASDIDAVAIISPPYFHPEQAANAVASGKHVYLAKPVAVDVPGCMSIGESGSEATKRKQVFLVDFQTRAEPFFIEAMKRVHEGAIGQIAFGEARYHAGRLGNKGQTGNAAEDRLRNWVFDKALSGDVIVEQNIHTLDVMDWVMPGAPLSATGIGGRKVRVDVGDCWDHFAALYTYANDVGMTFSSRQFNAHGAQGGILNRVFGEKGVLETKYGGNVMIRGGKEAYYRGGETNNIYKDGVNNNIATFHESITKGIVDNPTVAPSVQSNLVSVMGREACYGKCTVTWDELMKSTDRIEVDLTGLKA